MKITELLNVKGIELNVSVSSKDEAINKLIDLMCATGKISDKDAYKEGMLLAFMLVLLLEGLIMITIGMRLQILEILNLKSII